MQETLILEEEQERKEILNRYRKLLRHSKPFLKDNDAKLIKKAFNISNDAHKDMRRKSGEPYIYHPLDVAQICVSEIGLGTTSIISALLHDVVEDTDWEIYDIRREFGDKVAVIIDGLTKISSMPGESASEQAENFRKLLLTLAQDTRVILIKLADRLHNMRTLESMPEHKQLKIASETAYIYAPLAHRLGLYAIKTELEDLALKYHEPQTYKEITSKIASTKDARNRFIRNFIKPIEDGLKSQGLEVEIKGRPKSVYSIWNKMKKQGIPFEEIYDLFAIRIIIDTDLEHEKAACWQVYSMVTDFYQPNPDRLRDWISIPKSNGYESLHTTVLTDKGKWVEVQIRAKRMDDIAEKGYAAHWKYKDNSPKENESTLDMWINKVRETLEQNDMSNTKLSNGDQVEILTSNKQTPKEDWLKFVSTSKAKSKIKDFLKEDKKKAASEGKEIVIRKLRRMKLELNNQTISKLNAYFGTKTPLDFFYAVGKGKIDPKEIKKINEVKTETFKRLKNFIGSKIKDRKAKEAPSKEKHDVLLLGDDMDKLDYKFANCCKPIPGDDVFGFVTINDGIKIHRNSCPNANELMSNYGYRVVKAKWTSQQEIAFLAGLKVIGTDRLGMISDITKVISGELKVNMRSLTIETDNGIFDGNIQLFVNDTIHLNTLIKKLKKIEGVERITRYDLFEK